MSSPSTAPGIRASVPRPLWPSRGCDHVLWAIRRGHLLLDQEGLRLHHGRKQPARGQGCHWSFPLREPNMPFLALVHVGQVFCHLPPEGPGREKSTPWDWIGLGAELGHECPPPSLANRSCDGASEGDRGSHLTYHSRGDATSQAIRRRAFRFLIQTPSPPYSAGVWSPWALTLRRYSQAAVSLGWGQFRLSGHSCGDSSATVYKAQQLGTWFTLRTT